MTSSFPPAPIYPLAIDSDKTLLLVFNTSESPLSKENSAWADEIEIVPSSRWAENGYANINGELFYYDGVDRNSDNDVIKLKRCLRNLGGTKTQYNKAGTYVRGFVVAEHHKQVSLAAINIENFIGVDFSENRETLDYRIRRISDETNCLDDHTCPEVSFEYQELSVDNCSGTLIAYNTVIDGTFNNFTINFGDGSSTTTAQNGTHLYPPNSNIDPVIIVSNNSCQIVQTPILRNSTEEPSKDEPLDPFLVPIIIQPSFPGLILPGCQTPELGFTSPQFVAPCFNLGELGIPSLIIVDPPIQIPSSIEFGPVPSFQPIQIEVPSIPPIRVEFPSTIDIGNISIPPISFVPISFQPIQIEVPSIPPIQFGDLPSIPPIQFENAPSINVNWGTPPTVPVKLQCPGTNRTANFSKKGKKKSWKEKLESLSMIEEGTIEDDDTPVIEIETEIGVPSEIKIIQETQIPSKIDVVFSKLKIDEESLPRLKIDIPKEFPNIHVVGFPDVLRVEGIPDSIRVTGIPDEIIGKIKMPEEPIELVFKQGYIPIRFDNGLDDDDDNRNCFKLTPCRP